MINPHDSVTSPVQDSWEAICRLQRERLACMLRRTDLTPADLWYLTQALNWGLCTERQALTFDDMVEKIRNNGLWE